MNKSLSQCRVSITRRLIFAFIGSLLGGIGGLIIAVPISLLFSLISENIGIATAVVSVLVVGAIISIKVTSRLLKFEWKNMASQLIVPYLVITIGVVVLAYLHAKTISSQWSFLHSWAIFYMIVVFCSFSSLLGCIAIVFRKR